MKKIKVFLLAALLIVAAGCEDFLDINRDPNNPSEPNMQQLLPGIQHWTASILSLDFGAVGYANSVFTHQLSSRQPEYDGYGIAGSSFAVSRWWILYTNIMQNLELLISLAEEAENTQYAGVGKTFKAYVYSVMVDLWGDIPYTEANVKGNVHPVFDKDSDIYAELLALLDEAYTDLNTESTDLRTVGNDDLIYQGDINKWEKANRTIKLKLYTQVRKHSLYNQAAVDELLNNPTQLINSWAESFIFKFGPSASPDDRHPAFVSEYGGGQISMYISPWFYEIMNGENSAIFTNIVDPRIPYYFVNQKQGGAASQAPVEYRNGDFISIYFGSIGLNRDHAGRGTFSLMGIYPVGGKFDDGTAAPGAGLGIADGTGVAPFRFITYADRLYLEAELINVGKRTGDAREKLVLAMQESFRQVDAVVAGAKRAAQTVPVLHPTLSAPYITAVTDVYDAATTDARRLEIIMTQKWISSWGSHHDQYTDYRRTGYPVMFDPSRADHAPGGFVSGGPDGSGPVPVQRTRNYPLSWPYYIDEITLNNNAPDQKNITISRIFWDAQ